MSKYKPFQISPAESGRHAAFRTPDGVVRYAPIAVWAVCMTEVGGPSNHRVIGFFSNGSSGLCAVEDDETFIGYLTPDEVLK